jgi:hypothetical protein
MIFSKKNKCLSRLTLFLKTPQRVKTALLPDFFKIPKFSIYYEAKAICGAQVDVRMWSAHGSDEQTAQLSPDLPEKVSKVSAYIFLRLGIAN